MVGGRVVIEEGVRVSASQLWTMQRDFHERYGLEAFQPGRVPEYGTSNPYVAHQLLRVVLGYLRDAAHAGALDVSQPLYVVELGAGSGRFGHAFVRELEVALPELLEELPPIVYVLTDLSRATVDAWRAHPQLLAWFESGRMDVARFDGTDPDAALALEIAGVTLDAEALANPTVFLGNYFFDALPTDYFLFEGGRIHEVLARVTASEAAPDDPAAAIEDARMELAPRLLDSADVYGVAGYDRLLDRYREGLERSVLPFPIEGLRLVDRLAELTGGRMLLLSMDKGFAAERDLDHRSPPSFEVHGSVSLDANYHALASHLTEQHGGEALTVPRSVRWLTAVAVRLGDVPLKATRGAFREHFEVFGPNEYYVTYHQLRSHLAGRPLEDILAAWRFLRFDWTLLVWVYDALCEALVEASATTIGQLRTTLFEAWQTYFHTRRGDATVPRQIGTLLCRATLLADGLPFLEAAHQMAPDDVEGRYNLGTCLAQLGRFEEALPHLDAAAEADPDVAAFRDQVRDAAVGGYEPAPWDSTTRS